MASRMPRTTGPATRALWRGAGDAWAMVADLVTATGVWAGIGYGLDRWAGTWPVLFVIGTLAGHATGVYMLYRRSMGMAGRKLGGGTHREST